MTQRSSSNLRWTRSRARLPFHLARRQFFSDSLRPRSSREPRPEFSRIRPATGRASVQQSTCSSCSRSRSFPSESLTARSTTAPVRARLCFPFFRFRRDTVGVRPASSFSSRPPDALLPARRTTALSSTPLRQPTCSSCLSTFLFVFADPPGRFPALLSSVSIAPATWPPPLPQTTSNLRSSTHAGFRPARNLTSSTGQLCNCRHLISWSREPGSASPMRISASDE